jgi:3'-phosphoadenosine 5'-phosphosulfate sulfotransferase (PAPS reductase)/FAD synthetase
MPDLTQFDVLLVNTSAGKDSQAMLDYVVQLATAFGVKDRIVCVHADLGEAEWPGTRELAERQAAHYGLRLEVVRRVNAAGEEQPLIEQIEARGMFPDSARRYCTSDQKRGPVQKLMTALATEVRKGKGHRPKILNCMGLRAQESPARALKPALAHNDRASNSRKDVWEWLPIHAWTTDQVWTRIKASGVPYHPAYDLGMPRLSCRFCVLASKSALVLSAQLNPELAQRYLVIEERSNHTFRKGLSMAQIIAEAQATATIERIEDWAA